MVTSSLDVFLMPFSDLVSSNKLTEATDIQEVVTYFAEVSISLDMLFYSFTGKNHIRSFRHCHN